MSNAFDILGDPVRRRILELLAERDHASGELVAVVSPEFGISQAAVSWHLKVLREAGVASSRVEGARRIYSLLPGALHEVEVWLEGLRAAWAQRLDALATEVARGKRVRREDE